MRTPLVLFLIFASAAAAQAAEEIIQLKSGGIAVGEIVSTDERGVTLRGEKGEARYDWDALTPISVYEVRAGLLSPGTAAEHSALAEFCLRQGLYPYARREIATALGLAPGDPKALSDLEAAVNEAEADEAFARIGQLVSEEDYEKAIEEVRRFLLQAPPSAYTERARALVPDLLRRKDSLALREEEEARANEDLKQREALSERIAKLLADAERAMETAAASYGEALRFHELGNVTRARKGYLDAEQAYLAAHAILRKLQRLAPEGVAAEKAEKDKDSIRTRLVDIYLGLARLFVDDRNYKSGIVYVNKALYLDPVNREALDMRRKVDEDRIHRSLRRLTNSPGVITR